MKNLIWTLTFTAAVAMSSNAQETVELGGSDIGHGGGTERLQVSPFPNPQFLSEAADIVRERVKAAPYPQRFRDELVATLDKLIDAGAIKYVDKNVSLGFARFSGDHADPVMHKAFTRAKAGSPIYFTRSAASLIAHGDREGFAEELLHELLHQVLPGSYAYDEDFVNLATSSIMEGRAEKNITDMATTYFNSVTYRRGDDLREGTHMTVDRAKKLAAQIMFDTNDRVAAAKRVFANRRVEIMQLKRQIAEAYEGTTPPEDVNAKLDQVDKAYEEEKKKYEELLKSYASARDLAIEDIAATLVNDTVLRIVAAGPPLKNGKYVLIGRPVVQRFNSSSKGQDPQGIFLEHRNDICGRLSERERSDCRGASSIDREDDLLLLTFLYEVRTEGKTRQVQWRGFVGSKASWTGVTSTVESSGINEELQKSTDKVLLGTAISSLRSAIFSGHHLNVQAHEGYGWRSNRISIGGDQPGIMVIESSSLEN